MRRTDDRLGLTVQTSANTDDDKRLHQAMAHMESALGLLDQTDVPGEIGAYLDLCICRLGEAMPHLNLVARPTATN